MGGTGVYPNYGNYTQNNNYSETIRLLYDQTKTTYGQMLDHYWNFAGPSATFPSQDPAYQFRIFYNGTSQAILARAALAKWKAAAAKTQNQIYIDLYDASAYTFWKAEEYHQKYFWKNEGGDACSGGVPVGQWWGTSP